MTRKIGPRIHPAPGLSLSAKKVSKAGPDGNARPNPGAPTKHGRVDWERLAATGNGSPGHAPAHRPGQQAPASLRNPRRPRSSEAGTSSGTVPGSSSSSQSSIGSVTHAMDEILGKLGGNWKEIQKDLGSHGAYEKACDRNPFIRALLDPDIPSPRAGGPKDHWLQRPGPDLSGGMKPL
jgi:hypothetical protein